MRRGIRLGLVVALIVLGLGRAALAQISPEPWHNGIGKDYWEIGLKQSDREKMIALWDAIGTDLQSEQNSLAGTYFKGGYDAGYFLRWSPKRFILIPYFDEDLITDFSYGKVTFVDPSKVLFSPERDLSGGRSVGKTPREWTAIWRYFMATGDIQEFGLFQAGLAHYYEFNGECCEFWPNFFCQKVANAGAKTWYPVPPRYAHFIKQPIEGRVVWMGKKRFVKNWGYQGKFYGQWMEQAALIPVRIDLNGDRRVRRNMLFHMEGQPDFNQYLQIVKPGRRTSYGYIVRDLVDGKELYWDLDSDQKKPFPAVSVGMKVTTAPIPNIRQP